MSILACILSVKMSVLIKNANKMVNDKEAVQGITTSNPHIRKNCHIKCLKKNKKSNGTLFSLPAIGGADVLAAYAPDA